MLSTHTNTTTVRLFSTETVTRMFGALKRVMASDIVSYGATRGASTATLPNRMSRRAAVADIVGGVSDRETLAAA